MLSFVTNGSAKTSTMVEQYIDYANSGNAELLIVVSCVTEYPVTYYSVVTVTVNGKHKTDTWRRWGGVTDSSH